VVVWQNHPLAGEAAGTEITARRYGIDGLPAGDEFRSTATRRVTSTIRTWRCARAATSS
jgi:hypothetical protein